MTKSEIIEEILYILNHYFVKHTTKKEFSKEISAFIRQTKMSKKVTEEIVKLIFEFDPDDGFLVYQSGGGSCGGGGYVKRSTKKGNKSGSSRTAPSSSYPSSSC